MIGTVSDGVLAVKYVLYSHSWMHEKKDFEQSAAGADPRQLPSVVELLTHLQGLKELLNAPGHEGIFVIFYAPGYERFLAAISSNEQNIKQIIEADQGLRLARTVSECVKDELRKAGLERRVRFLTPLDLEVVLGRVNAISASKFRQYFIGRSKGIRYDAPKVVEAILRLRLIGTGIPVFRLDHDVAFNDDNKDDRKVGDLGLFKAIACALRAYRARIAQPAISTFMFSASYDSRPLLTGEGDAFGGWSRAFATRIFPALIADPIEISRIRKLPDQFDAWRTYEVDHVDEELACRYYGLKPIRGSLEPDDTNGLTSIGAHPLYAVISGALLCMSDGAILDLPPFSNFANNVMWIDDFLKYSLHRAMNHFISEGSLNIEPGLRNARLDDVMVTKARPANAELAGYIFGAYIPTLFSGAIFDAWITAEPILKCRASELQGTQRTAWLQAAAVQDAAPLPKAMLQALGEGQLSPDNEDTLQRELLETAARRIEQIRQLWATLQNKNGKTFACYWAEGTVTQTFGAFASPLAAGIAPGRPLNKPITDIGELDGQMVKYLGGMVSDTVDYVRWTLYWPQFVQIVRSIRQGKFIGDLTW